MSKRNLGSCFDKFLEENDLLEEVTAVAVKRVIAHQMAALSLTPQGGTEVHVRQIQEGRLKIQLQLKNKAA